MAGDGNIARKVDPSTTPANDNVKEETAKILEFPSDKIVGEIDREGEKEVSLLKKISQGIKGMNKDGRIKESISKMKDIAKAGVYAANSAKNVAVKTKNNSLRMLEKFLKIPWLITYLYFIVIYALPLTVIINTYMTRGVGLLDSVSFIGSNYLFSPQNMYWLTSLITGMIILFILIYAYPLASLEKKEQWINHMLHWSLLIMGAILIFGGIYAFVSDPLFSADEKAELVKVKVETPVSSFIATFKCSLDFKCAAEQAQSKTAEESDRIVNFITFKKPGNVRVIDVEDLTEESSIPLIYEFASTGGMTLEKLECYHDKVSSSNLFFTKTFESQDLNTNGNTDVLRNLECQKLNEIKSKSKKEKRSIISVVYIRIQSEATQQFPVVDYNSFESIVPPDQRGNSFQIRALAKKSLSNNVGLVGGEPLKVTLVGLSSALPIILGDEEQDEINFNLRLEKPTAFGTKIISGKVDIEIPEFIATIKNQDYNREITVDKSIGNTVYEQTITLVEAESQSSSFEDTLGAAFSSANVGGIYPMRIKLDSMITFQGSQEVEFRDPSFSNEESSDTLIGGSGNDAITGDSSSTFTIDEADLEEIKDYYLRFNSDASEIISEIDNLQPQEREGIEEALAEAKSESSNLITIGNQIVSRLKIEISASELEIIDSLESQHEASVSDYIKSLEKLIEVIDQVEELERKSIEYSQTSSSQELQA